MQEPSQPQARLRRTCRQRRQLGRVRRRLAVGHPQVGRHPCEGTDLGLSLRSELDALGWIEAGNTAVVSFPEGQRFKQPRSCTLSLPIVANWHQDRGNNRFAWFPRTARWWRRRGDRARQPTIEDTGRLLRTHQRLSIGEEGSPAKNHQKYDHSCGIVFCFVHSTPLPVLSCNVPPLRQRATTGPTRCFTRNTDVSLRKAGAFFASPALHHAHGPVRETEDW